MCPVWNSTCVPGLHQLVDDALRLRRNLERELVHAQTFVVEHAPPIDRAGQRLRVHVQVHVHVLTASASGRAKCKEEPAWKGKCKRFCRVRLVV